MTTKLFRSNQVYAVSREQWFARYDRTLFFATHKFSFGTAFCVHTERHLVALFLHDERRTESELVTTIRSRFQPTHFQPSTLSAEKTVAFPLLLIGTPFQISVWKTLTTIPSGRTTTYQELACMINQPQASRAVGNAVGRNPLGYLIPCHRVLRSDGTLGGFYWGPEKKRALLAMEKLEQ